MWLVHVPAHLGSEYILRYRVPRERTTVCSQQCHRHVHSVGLQPFSSGFPSTCSISNSCEHTARQKGIFLSFLGGHLGFIGLFHEKFKLLSLVKRWLRQSPSLPYSFLMLVLFLQGFANAVLFHWHRIFNMHQSIAQISGFLFLFYLGWMTRNSSLGGGGGGCEGGGGWWLLDSNPQPPSQVQCFLCSTMLTYHLQSAPLASGG